MLAASGVEIRPSSIAQLGLFASGAVAPRTVVLPGWPARHRHASTADPQRSRGAARSPVRGHDHCRRGPSPARAPGQANHYGNHSCDPNLWWADGFTLIARRPIVAGEDGELLAEPPALNVRKVADQAGQAHS